jgi:hypothetical protein
MKKTMKKTVLLICIMFLSFVSYSQEGDTHFNANVTSNFIWRGQNLSDKISVQPIIHFTKADSLWTNEIGTFSSFALDGSYKEVDLYYKVAYKSLYLMVTDYMLNVDDVFNYSDSTNNILEASLGYSFKFPLTLSYNVFVWGWDKDENDNQLYSSYVEASYLIKNINIFCGVNPYKSFYADGLAIVNLGLTLTKEINVNSSYSIPISTTLMLNPDSKKLFANLTFTF